MTVKITSDSKKAIMAYQLELARQVVLSMKDDESTATGYAKIAVNALYAGYDYCVDILKCHAEIARNCRVWNAFTDNSEDIDVWITGIAQTTSGFCEFGAYLTDVWNISADTAKDLVPHMFCIKYGREN